MLCGVRPPSMNSPGGCPGAISMSSGSKKLVAAVLARTTCASGRCRLPVNDPSAGVSQNTARGLFMTIQSLPVFMRLRTMQRPVRRSGLSSVLAPMTLVNSCIRRRESNLACHPVTRQNDRLKIFGASCSLKVRISETRYPSVKAVAMIAPVDVPPMRSNQSPRRTGRPSISSISASIRSRNAMVAAPRTPPPSSDRIPFGAGAKQMSVAFGWQWVLGRHGSRDFVPRSLVAERAILLG